MDDGVREHHGVQAADGGCIRIWETEQHITLRAWNNVSGVERQLCPGQARYLADRLYALASRIDRRQNHQPLVPMRVTGLAPVEASPAPAQVESPGARRKHERAVARGKKQWESLTDEQKRERTERMRAARWGKRDLAISL